MAPWLDRINCGVIGRDVDSRILFANSRRLRWTGYREAELLGKDVSMLFPPELRDRTRTEFRQSEEGDLRARLSTRETEVLSLLLSGQRVPSIAGQLHISPHTVRNHLKSMFRKLEVSTQAELIERVRSLSGAQDISA